MDPITILVMALAKNPELAASAAGAALKPGTVDVAKMQGSLVDLSKGILNCYHKTARLKQTELAATPYIDAWKYGAERSAVVRIEFEGMSRSPYQMLVAVMIKGNSVRSAVIQESTIVPYNKKCELEDWASPK